MMSLECRKLVTIVVALLAACPAAALDHTHVDNHLNTEIVATLTYEPGESKFVDRHIPAGGSDVDEYAFAYNHMKFRLKVVAPKDQCYANDLALHTDQSVAVLPIDGGAKQGFLVVDSSDPDDVIGEATCPSRPVIPPCSKHCVLGTDPLEEEPSTWEDIATGYPVYSGGANLGSAAAKLTMSVQSADTDASSLAGRLANQSPSCNVMVIQRETYVREEAFINNIVKEYKTSFGTNDYDVFVFETGEFTNSGDLGADNWVFVGNFDRSGDNGKTATFNCKLK